MFGRKKEIKYTPSTVHYEQIMRPPTEAIKPWLVSACVKLGGLINTEAYDIALKKGLLTPDNPPQVRIGTELELIIFSNKFNATEHTMETYDKGKFHPNYSQEHIDKVKSFVHDTMLPINQGGLGDILQSGDGYTKFSRTLTELRAKPVNIAGYLQNAETITNYMRTEGIKREIIPVVHSNHLHMSVTDSNNGSNLLKNDQIFHSVKKGVVDAYHRMLPAVRLPEEIDNVENNYSEVGRKIRNFSENCFKTSYE